MSKHRATRPFPSASTDLDLDDVHNNIGSKGENQRVASAFPATAEKGTRIKTKHAELVDLRRTVLEGLAVPTELQTVIDPTVIRGTQLGLMVSPSRVKSYPAHTPSPVSAAPPWAKSVLTKPEDQKMASRQRSFASLPPAEQAKQTNWALGIINNTIHCPQGWGWFRNEEQKGYQCEGRHHLVTDDLLAEGKGGVLHVPGGRAGQMEPWYGPYYPDPQNPKRLLYGGTTTGNHFSSFGPDWTEVEPRFWYWPKLWQLVPGLQGPPGNEADYPQIEVYLGTLLKTPSKIHRDSCGAKIKLLKDAVGEPKPVRSSRHSAAASPPSLRSPSNNFQNSVSGHVAQPSYHSNMNVTTPLASGFHPSNPFGSGFQHYNGTNPVLIPSALQPNSNPNWQPRSEFSSIGPSHNPRASRHSRSYVSRNKSSGSRRR